MLLSNTAQLLSSCCWSGFNPCSFCLYGRTGRNKQQHSQAGWAGSCCCSSMQEHTWKSCRGSSVLLHTTWSWPQVFLSSDNLPCKQFFLWGVLSHHKHLVCAVKCWLSITWIFSFSLLIFSSKLSYWQQKFLVSLKDTQPGVGGGFLVEKIWSALSDFNSWQYCRRQQASKAAPLSELVYKCLCSYTQSIASSLFVPYFYQLSSAGVVLQQEVERKENSLSWGFGSCSQDPTT